MRTQQTPPSPPPPPAPNGANGEATALATVSDEAAALAALNESTDGDVLYDGFSRSKTTEDFRLPRRLFNQSRGEDANGQHLRPDLFFDPVTQIAVPTIDAILILEHKSRAFTTYDEATEETAVICTSNDCVTGIEQANGKPRPCKGCPDAIWRKNANGKRSVNCTEKHNVLAVDIATREPFLITFQRTSARVIVDHVQRYHVGKREIGGRRENMPLYWRVVRLSLVRSENGKYAVPEIEHVRMCTPEEARAGQESAEAYFPIMSRAVDAADAEAADGGGDASFNTNEFSR